MGRENWDPGGGIIVAWKVIDRKLYGGLKLDWNSR